MRHDAVIAERVGSTCIGHLVLIEDWVDLTDANSGEVIDTVIANRSYEVRITHYNGSQAVQPIAAENEAQAIEVFTRCFLRYESVHPIEAAEEQFSPAPVADEYVSLPRYGLF